MDAQKTATSPMNYWKAKFVRRCTCYFVQYRLLLAPWLLLLLLSPVCAWASNFAYIENQSDATVSVVDTKTNARLAKVDVMLGPAGVAVNPAGTRLYVANLGPDTISVIDTATNMELATVPVRVFPFGIAVNSAGTRVYVTDLFDSTVSIIDAVTNTEIATMKLEDMAP